MSKASLSSSSTFSTLSKRFDEEVAKNIKYFGEKNSLRDACEYVLTNGGRRFRPTIVYLVAEALGKKLNVLDAALAVEFFHAASLIVDDLPCMDNAQSRREQPTVHRIYGEATALLASYALITAAFGKIHHSVEAMREVGEPYSGYCDKAGIIALETAAHCSGILGATGGQFYDLHSSALDAETIRGIMLKKTGTLFIVAFVFGWLFGGGDLLYIEQVKKMAGHFGLSFQIADDLHDHQRDQEEGRVSNFVSCVGKEAAFQLLQEEMAAFQADLSDLYIDVLPFRDLEEIIFAHCADL
jgi:geranylgeranyl diphosphate synthase type II